MLQIIQKINNFNITRKTLIKELKKALLTFALSYFLLFLLLLGYRYQTKRYYLNRIIAAKVIANKNDVNVVIADNNNNNYISQDTINNYTIIVDEYIDELSLSNAYMKSKLSKLEDLSLTIKSMEDSSIWKESLMESQQPEVDVTAINDMSLDHWKQLMTTSSLNEITSHDELQTLFQSAKHELETVLKQQERSGNTWKIVNQILQDQNLSTPKEDSVLVCPSQRQQLTVDGDTTIPSNIATKHDLHNHLQKFESVFSKRTQGAGINALMTETREEIEEITNQKIQLILDDVLVYAQRLEKKAKDAAEQLASSKDDKDDAVMQSSSSQVEKEFVLKLLDAGLLALSTKDDVRETLRKTALELDPSIKEDELILDADLPIETTNTIMQPQQQNQNIINLRNVIETPLLIKSMDWIDQFVELIGGYNDQLDQYIDSLTSEEDDMNSVGKIIIERLLNKAGLVNIDIQKYGDKLKIPKKVQQKVIEKLKQ